MSENLDSTHQINGVTITPVDSSEIGLALDWRGEANDIELNVDSLELANLGKKLVIDHLSDLGPFEGLPYTFSIGNFALDYYIDFTDNPVISGKGDSTVEVNIKRRNGLNQFKERADGLSFELLNKNLGIPKIDIPYLIVKDNQLEMLIMLGISAYTLTKALVEGIQALVEATTDFIKTQFAGTGVLVGQLISAVLLLLARIAYVAALTIALIEITKQIIELIFPPIRKFKASTVLTLMQTGCQYLGFNFSSTILEGLPELTILPVPLKKDNESIVTNLFTLDNGSYTKGYPTANDTTPTLGLLIDKMSEMFNAKIRVVNNTVHFERRDHWQLNAGLVIQSTLNLQDVRENRWSYNIGEAWKRYYLHYRTDPTDYHTLDQIKRTDCEYSTEPVTVQNDDLVSIKGLVDIAIPFAFGIRKAELTFVEKAAIPFAKLADEVVQFFGGDSSLEASIQGRIGVTMIGQQYFTTSKLLYQVGGRQPVNYLDIIGANTIYQQYHTINQVKENFKRIYNETIPFSTQQFQQLLYNNYVLDQEGRSLEILTFDWVNEGKTADISYAVLSSEGFNTKTILIDGD